MAVIMPFTIKIQLRNGHSMAGTKKNLVIVESPAKAKTIGKYLGPDYKVTASMGHLRDLPKSTLGVDIENGFIPEYSPVKGREDTIKELEKEARSSKRIYLATDPDREGEAISWHLKELLHIPDDEVYRVTFNEITKKVVQDSIQHPRGIDQNLVDAQQARRILDRIVGYKLSPLLWKKIKRGLSAGRVQSVATRIVVDREEEIRAFVPEEYWLMDAKLRHENGGVFLARYYGFNGKKAELKTAEDVQAVEDAVKNAAFTVKSVKRKDHFRSPSPPFITSSLQQEASRKLSMTPRRTMAVAQQLYEGVDIEGEGTVGLITYMRTDSLRLSDEALHSAGDFISGRYGKEYYNGYRTYKTKSGAQDAHEAIRPTDPFRSPDIVKGSLAPDLYRLYRLIWNRFIASQMTNAVYDNVTTDVESAGHMFRSSSSILKFAGFTAVYEESADDDSVSLSAKLPIMVEGETLKLMELIKEQKFTSPPPRYTEATLIREMEESGIGRPSTYAPTISTILDRTYVIKEGKFLRPTPLGEVVTQLMKDRFTNVVDTNFTARMEELLDSVEKGNKPWKDVLYEFYGPFNESLENAEKALEGERIKIPAEESNEICEVCGRKMVVKTGRFGRFLACSGYPECTFTKPLVIEMPGKCPQCGSRILKCTSKKGYTFYACERRQECGFMTWDVPTQETCPECGHTLFKKSGRGFNKPFCINDKCPNFLPEENRRYRKKESNKTAGTAGDEVQEDNKEAPAETKTTERKEKPTLKLAAKTVSKAGKTVSATKSTKISGSRKTEKPDKETKTTRKRTSTKAAKSTAAEESK